MATEGGAPDDDERDRGLLLDQIGDRLERFRLLTDVDDTTAGQVLAGVDVRNARERQAVLELADRQPVAHPERFDEAHRLAVHALEVLDRHGWRSPRVPRLGPFRPIASITVEWVARYIVRSYQHTVIDAMRNLYGRREAQCAPDDPTRRMLARARIQADRLTPGFKGNPFGVPTFLLTGATISLVFSLGRQALDVSIGRTAAVILGAISFLLFAGLAWVLLRGAAVAHRRVVVIIERPLDALWETVGNCGRPPRDDSTVFAWVAILLTALAWFVAPIAIGLAIAFLD